MATLWKNERGSALLFVMYAVVITGVLFSALYAYLQYSTKQAFVHEQQVQAEYDAQKAMEIALYEFYYQNEIFNSKYSACTGNHAEGEPQVCVETQENESQILVATGYAEEEIDGSKPTREIRFNLPISTADGGTGGTPLASNNDSLLNTAPSPSDNDPNHVIGNPEGNASPKAPYAGTEACVANPDDLLLRAVMLGSDFDLARAMPDVVRQSSMTSDRLNSVEVYGGLYVGGGKQLLLPNEKSNDKFDTSFNLNGYLFSEGGLAWKNGNGHLSNLSYERLGDAPIEDPCRLSLGFETYLRSVTAQVKAANRQQQVPVYKFTGNLLTLASTGTKKTVGATAFTETFETLGQVLSDVQPKIVLVEGNLLFNPSGGALRSTAYLLVYNADAPTTIYLPDGLAWEHNGAIAVSQIGRYTSDGQDNHVRLDEGVWPQDYRLYVTLTESASQLYQQPAN